MKDGLVVKNSCSRRRRWVQFPAHTWWLSTIHNLIPDRNNNGHSERKGELTGNKSDAPSRSPMCPVYKMHVHTHAVLSHLTYDLPLSCCVNVGGVGEWSCKELLQVRGQGQLCPSLPLLSGHNCWVLPPVPSPVPRGLLDQHGWWMLHRVTFPKPGL